ncbi:germination protein YpeB [Thalassobacillus hwangdonensis]|uniref:Germination protein YpeB n=1 Tax=Thalassobacillus hwangdonensis TaxID=546108 RepID=A0ABW3L0C7_9BACI
MIRWILITILTVGVVGAGIWGYQEHQDKNAVLIQAENNYQRAFHELSFNMDLMHDKIGTVLAMNTRKQLSPELANIWRITSEAHSDVGQLPLALLPFNKTEEFLYDIGDFTYRTAIRDLEKEPLSEDEVKHLEKLYEQSGTINNELRKVQHMVLENNLRWMDVQLALATNDQQGDNTIIDGFKTVEKTVSGYEEGNSGPSITGVSNESNDFKGITGEKISEGDAKEIARKLFNVKEKQKITVAKSGKGADVPTYSVSYNKGDKNAYADLSEKGGHPLTLMVSRPVEDSKISLYEGIEKSQSFIEQLKFPEMDLIQSSQYERVGVYTFVPVQDDVRIFPDSIQIKVALDNGDVIAMSAKDYFSNHQERTLPDPSYSEEEAREKVNPSVDIQEQHLAVIENDLNEEVLCYEFLGTMGNETYRIFINAENGQEEKVEKLKAAEMKFAESV